jgi:hypothetical protein
MNCPCRLLFAGLIAPLLWGQQTQPAPGSDGSPAATSYSVETPRIFPSLSYGPHAWSLLHLTNPSGSPKSAKVDVYCAKGDRLPLEPVYTVSPHGGVDIRIEGNSSKDEMCWARIEDVSQRKSKPSLQANARAEEVNGNKLEEFPQRVAKPERNNHWLSPAASVSNRDLFFLNTSDKATVLDICSIDIRTACRESIRVRVEAKQSVVLKVGTLRKTYLLIQSSVTVPAVIGLLRAGPSTSRVFSTESSIDFN